MTMPLTSIITVYNPDWPAKYEEEAMRVRPVFGDTLLEIHHVGSTAIPELAAKPEIDILVVVTTVSAAARWTIGLSGYGYTRGRDMSRGHLFYKRNVCGVRTHKIHVCLESHEEIEKMLKFRDYLRSHREVCEEYEALKLKLERENTAGIGEYLDGKAPFIEGVLSAID